MVAEFARLLPRSVLDSELSILIRDKTTQFYAAVSEAVAATSAVLSINGRTGKITLTAEDVGLGAVENISPADLPLSTAATQALGTKWGKEAPIPQEAIAALPADLAARVRTVNGQPPDETGNVVVDSGQANFIVKPEQDPEDKEVLTWIVGMGWTPVSIQQHLILGAGNRILPDPATAKEGDVVTLVEGAWTARPPAAVKLTSPDGTAWTLTVSNAGELTATRA